VNVQGFLCPAVDATLCTKLVISRPAMPSQPSKDLQSFKNPAPDRDYEIVFDVPEFTCLCPLTGQPDFASFKIRYIPDELCVELKSLKMYMWSYRNEGAFHEAVTNKILDDLVNVVHPREMTVEGDFFVRGGIRTVVTARFKKPGR
jgi:7-cyano-7-deazaguanine reductase